MRVHGYDLAEGMVLDATLNDRAAIRTGNFRNGASRQGPPPESVEFTPHPDPPWAKHFENVKPLPPLPPDEAKRAAILGISPAEWRTPRPWP